jgi:hypothetical protein
MGVEDAGHLLQRAGFGARPADLAEFSRLTRGAAIERLLLATPTEAGTPVPAELAGYMPPAGFENFPTSSAASCNARPASRCAAGGSIPCLRRKPLPSSCASA